MITKYHLVTLSLLFTSYCHVLYSMDLQPITDNTLPKTLFAYFNLQSLECISKDVHNDAIAPYVTGAGGWWYIVQKNKIKPDNATTKAIRFTGDAIGIVMDNPSARTFDLCKKKTLVQDLMGTQLGEPHAVEAIDYSTHCPGIAITRANGDLYVHDQKDIHAIPLENYRERIKSLSTHPTAPIISLVTKGKQASLFDVTTKRRLITLPAKHITCDAGKTCIGTFNGTSEGYIYDFSGNKRCSLRHSDQVHDLTFNSTLRMIATASQDKTVCLWSFIGEKLQTLVHQGPVRIAKFNTEGTLLATVASEHAETLSLWNCNGSRLRTLSHYLPIKDIDLHPTYASCISATGKRIYIWAEHSKPTLKQVLLRQVIKLWVIETICKEIFLDFDCTSQDQIPLWMAQKFNLQKEELDEIWNSMPPALRQAIYKTLAKPKREWHPI